MQARYYDPVIEMTHNNKTADEIASFVDNVTTLADRQFTADDVFAVIDLANGFGGEAKGVVYKVAYSLV